ncbi:hypothetical protein E2C01_034696 [Portunus trituberculatus]|uniref:Uncharacterized protein n=1 Tax=Portunus trituberculatus TaxID=210409 RepID=A0A5B7F3H4_PORTR|nr:hypothetical protein [Portunus trituberculatus]
MIAPLPWCEWSERGYNVVEQSAGAAITLPVQQDSAGESNLPSHSNSPSLSLHSPYFNRAVRSESTGECESVARARRECVA